MAKLRVLLDDNLSGDLAKAFSKKISVVTVDDLGMKGAGDPKVIEQAIYRKCLIVTNDRSFTDDYRDHPWRKGHDGRFFYGLIYLVSDNTTALLRLLKLVIPRLNPECDEAIQAGGRLLQRLPPEPIGQNLPLPLTRSVLFWIHSNEARQGFATAVMSITTSEGEIDTADPLTVIFADPVISIPPFEKIVVSHLCHLPGS